MFIKRSANMTTIQDLVERNTGMPAEEFLNPEPYPYISGLDDAVKVFEANASKPVTIVGDYDMDGIMATSIMYHGLLMYGVKANTRLPHRFSEGYGLSEKIIDEIKPGSLVVTVDNGIAALPAIKKAKKKGMTVIVIDHHIGVPKEGGGFCLPEADIIVDPMAESPLRSEFANYCGAALAYRFIHALLPDRDLTDLLILAAIATVTDVMPLLGANRWILLEGLRGINSGRGVPGLRMLLEKINLTEHITEEDFGFSIGPIGNAAGRLYDNGAEMSLSLFIAGKNDRTLGWRADFLIKTNEKRKKIERESMETAKSLMTKERPIVVYHESFGEGIIGLIAGRLCEKYKCPVVVFTKAEDGNLKGSGRSDPGHHLKKILDSIQDQILKYGGHAGAAGLTIAADKLEDFKKAFFKAVGPIEDESDRIFYDLDIHPKNFKETIRDLKKYAPYGEKNPRPRFRLSYEVSPKNYRRIGDGTHFLVRGNYLTLMGFCLAEKYEQKGSPKFIDVVGSIEEHWWKNNCSYQMQVLDFEPKQRASA